MEGRSIDGYALILPDKELEALSSPPLHRTQGVGLQKWGAHKLNLGSVSDADSIKQVCTVKTRPRAKICRLTLVAFFLIRRLSKKNLIINKTKKTHDQPVAASKVLWENWKTKPCC